MILINRGQSYGPQTIRNHTATLKLPGTAPKTGTTPGPQNHIDIRSTGALGARGHQAGGGTGPEEEEDQPLVVTRAHHLLHLFDDGALPRFSSTCNRASRPSGRAQWAPYANNLPAISPEGTSYLPHMGGTVRLWVPGATVAKETYSICSLAGSLQASASLSPTVCQGSCHAPTTVL